MIPTVERPKDITTMTWTDWRGYERKRDVNQTLDIRNFLGTAGYSLLLVAANTHLALSDIELFLSVQVRDHPNVQRSRSWLQKRRWLFQKPGTNNAKGATPNLDGRYKRAVAVMSEHPNLSVRDLTMKLREYGIIRSREWVRKHRCDPTA